MVGEIARSAMVTLPPSTPIQVLGAWPDADTVIVAGLLSSLQPAPPVPPSGSPPVDVKRVSPVESVSAWHGSSSPAKTEPHMIPGGGIADGPLHGTLNVFVIDEDTRNAVSSATVRVSSSMTKTF